MTTETDFQALSATMTTALYLTKATDIVTAYVSKNSVPATDLPALIAGVHAALKAAAEPPAEPVEDHTVSPSAIRKSITPDHITSFIDGKTYRSLKRHLTANGHTPESYRQKYGLPKDYPFVASSYAAQRSELAKNSGLGQRRKLRAVA